MRIITGIARGAKLEAPAGLHTRPTAERTKEAVFSMLGGRFATGVALDLFAGSGQLGLEAVSRGAAKAILVERDKTALATLRKNATHTKLDSLVEIKEAEALSFLRTYTGEAFRVIFLDPPYGAGLLPLCLEEIARRRLLHENGVVVCESATGDVFGENTALAAQFSVLRAAKYGVAHVTVLAWKEGAV